MMKKTEKLEFSSKLNLSSSDEVQIKIEKKIFKTKNVPGKLCASWSDRPLVKEKKKSRCSINLYRLNERGRHSFQQVKGLLFDMVSQSLKDDLKKKLEHAQRVIHENYFKRFPVPDLNLNKSSKRKSTNKHKDRENSINGCTKSFRRSSTLVNSFDSGPMSLNESIIFGKIYNDISSSSEFTSDDSSSSYKSKWLNASPCSFSSEKDTDADVSICRFGNDKESALRTCTMKQSLSHFNIDQYNLESFEQEMYEAQDNGFGDCTSKMRRSHSTFENKNDVTLSNLRSNKSDFESMSYDEFPAPNNDPIRSSKKEPEECKETTIISERQGNEQIENKDNHLKINNPHEFVTNSILLKEENLNRGQESQQNYKQNQHPKQIISVLPMIDDENLDQDQSQIIIKPTKRMENEKQLKQNKHLQSDDNHCNDYQTLTCLQKECVKSNQNLEHHQKYDSFNDPISSKDEDKQHKQKESMNQKKKKSRFVGNFEIDGTNRKVYKNKNCHFGPGRHYFMKNNTKTYLKKEDLKSSKYENNKCIITTNQMQLNQDECFYVENEIAVKKSYQDEFDNNLITANKNKITQHTSISKKSQKDAIIKSNKLNNQDNKREFLDASGYQKYIQHEYNLNINSNSFVQTENVQDAGNNTEIQTDSNRQQINFNQLDKSLNSKTAMNKSNEKAKKEFVMNSLILSSQEEHQKKEIEHGKKFENLQHKRNTLICKNIQDRSLLSESNDQIIYGEEDNVLNKKDHSKNLEKKVSFAKHADLIALSHSTDHEHVNSFFLDEKGNTLEMFDNSLYDLHSLNPQKFKHGFCFDKIRDEQIKNTIWTIVQFYEKKMLEAIDISKDSSSVVFNTIQQMHSASNEVFNKFFEENSTLEEKICKLEFEKRELLEKLRMAEDEENESHRNKITMETDFRSLNQSLIGVNDICAELNQQTEELKKEIERLNIELSNEKIQSNKISQNFTKKVNEFDKKCNELQIKSDQQKLDQEKLQLTNQRLNARIDQKDQEIKDQIQNLEAAKQENITISLNVQRVLNDNKKLSVQLNDNIEETNRIIKIKNELEIKLFNTEKQYELLNESKNKYEVQLSKINKDLEKEKLKNKSLKQAFEKIENDKLRETKQSSDKNKSLEITNFHQKNLELVEKNNQIKILENEISISLAQKLIFDENYKKAEIDNQNLKSNILELENVIRALRTKVDDHQNSRDNLENKINELNDRIHNLRRINDQLQTTNNKIQQHNDILVNQFNDLNQRSGELELEKIRIFQQGQNDNKALNDQLSVLQNKINTLVLNNQNITDDNSNLNNDYNNIDNKNKELESEIQKLTDKILNLENDLRNQRTNNDQLQHQNVNKQIQINKLSEDKYQQQQRNQVLRNDINDLQLNLTQLKIDVQNLSRTKNDLEKEKTALCSNNKLNLEQIKDLIAEICQLNATTNIDKQQIKQLSQSNQEFQNHINQLQNQLNNSSNYQYENIHLVQLNNELHNKLNQLNGQFDDYKKNEVIPDRVMKEKIIRLEDQIKTVENENNRIKTNLRRIKNHNEPHIQTLQNKNKELNNSNKDLNDKNTHIEQQNNILRDSLSVINEEKKHLVEQINALEASKNQNEDLKKALNDEIKILEQQYNSLHDRINKLDKYIVQLEENKKNNEIEIKKQNQEICALRTNSNNNEKLIPTLKKKCEKIEEEYKQYKITEEQKKEELKNVFNNLIYEFEGKFNIYQKEYNKIQQELKNERNKNDILKYNIGLDSDQLKTAKAKIEILSNKLESYDSLKTASSKLLERIKQFEKYKEEDDLITNDGSTYGDDSMDFENNENNKMRSDFFILDGKNDIFKLSEIKHKKNPLSSCPFYNCNGKNNTGYHKCGRTCPKIQKLNLLKCDLEPEMVIFESVQDIPNDFSIYRPQETLEIGIRDIDGKKVYKGPLGGLFVESKNRTSRDYIDKKLRSGILFYVSRK